MASFNYPYSQVLTYDVLPYSEEYTEVEQIFLKSHQSKTISLNLVRIQKVESADLSEKFENSKLLYSIKYGNFKVHKLFHGTKSSNIPSILRDNLNYRLHGQSTGHRFGAGVSFSAQASYAHHYCDKGPTGQMLLCDVIISNIVEVPEMVKGKCLSEPPYLPGNSFMRYDTTAKSKTKMDVVVKWNDHEYFPTYVIHFKRQKRSSQGFIQDLDPMVMWKELLESVRNVYL